MFRRHPAKGGFLFNSYVAIIMLLLPVMCKSDVQEILITARKIKEDINYERKIIPSRQCLLVQVMLIWDDDNGIEDFDIHLLAQDICTP